MAKPKVNSYEDKKFDITQSVYNVLANILEDIKRDVNSNAYTWNKPVEELKGITLTLIGQDHLQLNYHKYVVCNQYQLAQLPDDDGKFMTEVEKELKKRYKKIAKKDLGLKKVKEDRDIQLFSRLTADTSWMLSSSRYGANNIQMSRYHVRCFRIYTFDNTNA